MNVMFLFYKLYKHAGYFSLQHTKKKEMNSIYVKMMRGVTVSIRFEPTKFSSFR
jgi:hypothetical protein